MKQRTEKEPDYTAQALQDIRAAFLRDMGNVKDGDYTKVFDYHFNRLCVLYPEASQQKLCDFLLRG